MNQLLNIHPENPQGRLLQIAVDKLRTGGVVAYPTDTSYALACHIGDKRALDRIIGIDGSINDTTSRWRAQTCQCWGYLRGWIMRSTAY